MVCDNDTRNVVSGDASVWVPLPSPQGGASNDDARMVMSDDVLSQDDTQDDAHDGHDGGRCIMSRSITMHKQTASERGEGGG